MTRDGYRLTIKTSSCLYGDNVSEDHIEILKEFKLSGRVPLNVLQEEMNIRFQRLGKVVLRSV